MSVSVHVSVCTLTARLASEGSTVFWSRSWRFSENNNKIWLSLHFLPLPSYFKWPTAAICNMMNRLDLQHLKPWVIFLSRWKWPLRLPQERHQSNNRTHINTPAVRNTTWRLLDFNYEGDLNVRWQGREDIGWHLQENESEEDGWIKDEGAVKTELTKHLIKHCFNRKTIFPLTVWYLWGNMMWPASVRKPLGLSDPYDVS